MDLISTVMNWTYKLIATWYGAAIIGGVLILAFERWDRRREPSEADVRQAVDRYRQWYGDDAVAKIGDHMLAASFAPDGRHRRFLRRVAIRLGEPSKGPASENSGSQAIR
ncbi:MAG: hypothetical protein EWV79_12925 [Microcystis aeruginosa Ma_MB_S_20031200_S102D]|nr:MAG: hypothetical protein EWV79_12925 [Microcystis aeruginosa Ma_MB_S_20031200_S102D]